MSTLQSGIADGEIAASLAILGAFESSASIKNHREHIGWWAGFVTTIAGAMNEAVGPEQAQAILNSCSDFSKTDAAGDGQ